VPRDYGLSTTGDLPVSVHVPGYRLRRQVGEDSLGLWFDAEQRSLERNVTLKLLRPQYEMHEGARGEFLAEMERLAPLAHPNVLRVLDSVREGTLALVTERFAPPTLENLLEGRKPLEKARALVTARGIARGLAYLQSKGLAHKNLTPRLVQILDDGEPRLATFRNVLPAAGLGALKGRLVQDANYVAPEQVGGDDPIGPRTPVYQLGALLFHMLAGKPPHSGATPADVARAHFRAEFPSLRRLQPFLLPGSIYDLVAACTRREPSARPALDEVFAALEELAPRTPIGGATGAPVLRRRRRRR